MRWRRRIGRVAAIAIVLPTLASCSARADDATEANCPIEDGELFVLMAQSVPSATLIPCIEALPAGWMYGGSDVNDALARFWLDSDRGGLHAVEVSLTASCRITGAVDVTNSTSEGGVRVYLHEFTLHPFSANEYFVFPGGCVTYDYSVPARTDPELTAAADGAVGFLPRGDLAAYVHEQTGQPLCGAGTTCPGTP